MAFVALSGGVDSSVAALLLLEQGYRVVAVTLRLHEGCGLPGARSCCALEDVLDARRVAGFLGIEHRVLEHQEAFERLVVTPFAESYSRGETPNPCILCNERIKFGTLWEYAKANGADFVATGHHARMRGEGARAAVWRAADIAKDQSYVLFTLDADCRSRTFLPVGEITKEEVREKARRAGLPTAEKPESQDICFVGPEGYAGFLKRRGVTGVAGEIRHMDGRVLGSHRGIHLFTVGQRRGLGIPAAEPLFVTALDPDSGTVWVGSREAVGVPRFRAVGWRWHLAPGDQPPAEALVQVRYRQEAGLARLFVEGGGAVVIEWAGPPRVAAPGQAAVAYEGDRLIGGGWIARQRNQ